MGEIENLHALIKAQDAIKSLSQFSQVRWCSATASVVEGVHLGTSLDVTVNSICDGDLLPWLWTVVNIDDVDAIPGGELSVVQSPIIAVEFDVVVWAVYDPTQRWYNELTAVVYPVGEEPASDEMAALYDMADLVDGEIEQIFGWRSSTIDQALEQWCLLNLDRGDLRFSEDPDEVPYFVEMLVSKDEMSQQQDQYIIAEGVYISDTVFDDLLSMDPSQAARITSVLQELADSGFRPVNTKPVDDDPESTLKT